VVVHTSERAALPKADMRSSRDGTSVAPTGLLPCENDSYAPNRLKFVQQAAISGSRQKIDKLVPSVGTVADAERVQLMPRIRNTRGGLGRADYERKVTAEWQ
jgi:hypothetical protein